MTTFLLAFGMLAVVMLLMAVGVAFGKKPIQGSCGGLSAVGMKSACDLCGKDPKDCEKKKA